MIDQIDMVPTLSRLLGIPIPFCNLGFLIDGVKSKDPRKPK
jgi:hypothetical protein